ncbi:MAG: hypothetical protein QXO40_02340 [Candidatus Aenigmatarchaeota archaeon]
MSSLAVSPPSIVTDLKWSVVRYKGKYSCKVTIRITATFINIGGKEACCLDNSFRSILRRITLEGNVGVWRDKLYILSKGQSITFIKDYRVSCSREFTFTFEVFYQINCENPAFMICVELIIPHPKNTKDIYNTNLK